MQLITDAKRIRLCNVTSISKWSLEIITQITSRDLANWWLIAQPPRKEKTERDE